MQVDRFGDVILSYSTTSYMSRQHRYLLILILLASVVTIVFQCFWLYSNYQQEKDTFIAYAERLLFESIQEERELQLIKNYPDIYHELRQTGFKGNYPGLLLRELTIKNKLGQHRKGPPPNTLHPPILPAGFAHLELSAIQKRLRSKLGKELEQTFFLDTIHITRGEFPRAIPPHPFGDTALGRGPLRQPVVMLEVGQKVIQGFPIQGATMMLNPSKDLFLTLYLNPPTSWILKHLAWAFLASLFLVIITIGCLIYLLYTIFKQKKLADIKNDFVNNMTHELKTPLSTVIAATESLQQFHPEEDPKRTQLYLQMVHKAATHLSNLIDQTLHLAVGENRGMHLQREPIDIHKFLHQLIEIHQVSHQQTIKLTVEEPTVVYIDRIHMTNAINNLLDNAVKYAADQVMIEVISQVVEEHWVLQIADNGVGIAPSHIKQIFQPFYRVPTGDIHQVKGFGLGLHYVKQVVIEHKGSIEVESLPGKGSIFTFKLPLNI